jgi:outer membrane immunogenic protein
MREIEMRYVIRVGLVALAAIAVPLAAQAADKRIKPVKPIYKGPPPIVAYNWSGCYFGGQIGGQWTRWTAHVSYPAAAPTVVASRDFEGDGTFLYGGQLGCNFQPIGSNFLLGVEGDIAGTSGDGFHGEIYRFPATVDHFDASGRASTQASLRLRLGLTFDRLLLYVAGGGTWARLSASHLIVRDGVGVLETATSRTRSGWNIGVGGEYAFDSNFTVGLEYRYTDYGSFDFNVPAGTFPFAFAAFTASANDIHTQDVRLRFNYLFNTGPVVARN